jgi:hypothetical protein
MLIKTRYLPLHRVWTRHVMLAIQYTRSLIKSHVYVIMSCRNKGNPNLPTWVRRRHICARDLCPTTIKCRYPLSLHTHTSLTTLTSNSAALVIYRPTTDPSMVYAKWYITLTRVQRLTTYTHNPELYIIYIVCVYRTCAWAIYERCPPATCILYVSIRVWCG